MPQAAKIILPCGGRSKGTSTAIATSSDQDLDLAGIICSTKYSIPQQMKKVKRKRKKKKYLVTFFVKIIVLMYTTLIHESLAEVYSTFFDFLRIYF